MKKYFMYMAVMTAVVLMSVSAVQAEPMKADDGLDRQAKWEQRAERMHEKLGLSEEQKTQLKAHKEKHREEGKAQWEQIKAKKEELRAELQKADLDEGKVRKLHNAIKVLKNQAEDARLEGILEVRRILTAEQFAQFEDMRKKMWKHKKGDGEGDDRHSYKKERPMMKDKKK